MGYNILTIYDINYNLMLETSSNDEIYITSPIDETLYPAQSQNMFKLVGQDGMYSTPTIFENYSMTLKLIINANSVEEKVDKINRIKRVFNPSYSTDGTAEGQWRFIELNRSGILKKVKVDGSGAKNDDGKRKCKLDIPLTVEPREYIKNNQFIQEVINNEVLPIKTNTSEEVGFRCSIKPIKKGVYDLTDFKDLSKNIYINAKMFLNKIGKAVGHRVIEKNYTEDNRLQFMNNYKSDINDTAVVTNDTSIEFIETIIGDNKFNKLIVKDDLNTNKYKYIINKIVYFNNNVNNYYLSVKYRKNNAIVGIITLDRNGEYIRHLELEEENNISFIINPNTEVAGVVYFCLKKGMEVALPMLEYGSMSNSFNYNSRLYDLNSLSGKNLLINSGLKVNSSNNNADGWTFIDQSGGKITQDWDFSKVITLENKEINSTSVVLNVENNIDESDISAYIEQLVEHDFKNQYYNFNFYGKSNFQGYVYPHFVIEILQRDASNNIIKSDKYIINKDITTKFELYNFTFKIEEGVKAVQVRAGINTNDNVTNNTFSITALQLEENATPTLYEDDDYNVTYFISRKNLIKDPRFLSTKVVNVGGQNHTIPYYWDMSIESNDNLINSNIEVIDTEWDVNDVGQNEKAKAIKINMKREDNSSKKIFLRSNPIPVLQNNNYTISTVLKQDNIWEYSNRWVYMRVLQLDSNDVVIHSYYTIDLVDGRGYTAGQFYRQYEAENIEIKPNVVKVVIQIEIDLNNASSYGIDNVYDVQISFPQFEKSQNNDLSTTPTSWVSDDILTQEKEIVAIKEVYVKNPRLETLEGQIYWKWDGLINWEEEIIIDTTRNNRMCYIKKKDGTIQNILSDTITYLYNKFPSLENEEDRFYLVYKDDGLLNENDNSPVKKTIIFTWDSLV